MVLGWSPFNSVSDSPALHSKWLLLLKIEMSLVVNFSFITNHWTQILTAAIWQWVVEHIFWVFLWDLGILWDKNHIKIFCSEIWVEMIFGWPTFKICVTPPFSINFRSQIENQVSDYRLLGASSSLLRLISSEKSKYVVTKTLVIII